MKISRNRIDSSKLQWKTEKKKLWHTYVTLTPLIDFHVKWNRAKFESIFTILTSNHFQPWHSMLWHRLNRILQVSDSVLYGVELLFEKKNYDFRLIMVLTCDPSNTLKNFKMPLKLKKNNNNIKQPFYIVNFTSNLSEIKIKMLNIKWGSDRLRPWMYLTYINVLQYNDAL